MTLAGLLLIVAALLKSHELLTEPIISKGFWESWEFFIIQIPLELGLGIWLVSGLFKKAAWLLATIAFAGFIGVTLYKGLTGEASCGCFGKIEVNPWITLFAMDVPILIALVIFRPKGEKLLPPPWPHPAHFIPIAMLTSFLLGALIPTLIFNKPGDEGIGRSGRQYLVIRPENWTGSSTKTDPNQAAIEEYDETQIAVLPDDLPSWKIMLNHVDIADKLKSGAAVVLFYHADCPDCREAVPIYEKYNQKFTADEQFNFAFIKVPPYSDPSQDIVPADTTAMVGKLDQSRDWIFQTPLIFLLNDGELIQWWQVKYPDLDEILNTLVTAQ